MRRGKGVEEKDSLMKEEEEVREYEEE